MAYLSIRYTERLAEAGAVTSVGSRGDSYENALAESFHGLYKAELIHKDGPWRGLDDVEFATLDYLDFFNHRAPTAFVRRSGCGAAPRPGLSTRARSLSSSMEPSSNVNPEGRVNPTREVEELVRTTSASAARTYGLERVCQCLRVPRSTLYWRRAKDAAPATTARKRGLKTAWIREVVVASPFVGEGYRKAWARLRLRGVRTSKRRVNRLMREAGLLAPSRSHRPLRSNEHDGTITTATPDEMWGTDATSCVTGEGMATIFLAVDDCATECAGIHAACPGTRLEAIEVIRQGVIEHFGPYAENVATGLAIRHDHGSQFMSDHYQDELRFLGMESSPAFVRQPEGNGCAERFVRTLKGQVLWTRWFATVEELRLALLDFKRRYNAEWLVECHQHRTPSQVRAALQADLAA